MQIRRTMKIYRHLANFLALLVGCSMISLDFVEAGQRFFPSNQIDHNGEPDTNGLNKPAIGTSGDSPVGTQFRARILPRRDTVQNSKKFVCYYNNQGALSTQKGRCTIDVIDAFLCTHLIYMSFGLDERGQIRSLIPEVDLDAQNGKNMLKRFSNLKNSNPTLKTMLAIEGDSKRYSAMAASPVLRANFVKSAVDYMTKYDLNGMDIIWKYPNDPRGTIGDKENFVTLLEELRGAFKAKGHLLSAALPVGTRRIEAGIDVPKMSKLLDFINLMTYDYNGSWDNETGLHAPLRESPRYDRTESDKELNVAWSIMYWLKMGADPRKLMLGVTSYGRTFTLKDANSNGINAPIKNSGKPGPYTKNDRLWGYNEICEAMEQNYWKVVRDPDYKAPYAVKGDQWIGYEDPESAALKAQYALSQRLGGVTLSSLCTDDFLGKCKDPRGPYPIASTIKMELNQSKLVEERSSLFSPYDDPNESSEVPRLPTGAPPVFGESNGPSEVRPTVSPFESSTVTETPTPGGVRLESSTVGSDNLGLGTSFPLPVCGANGQWYFPGPNCRQYVDCTDDKPILKQCRDNLVWKQSRLWCDHLHNVPECQ